VETKIYNKINFFEEINSNKISLRNKKILSKLNKSFYEFNLIDSFSYYMKSNQYLNNLKKTGLMFLNINDKLLLKEFLNKCLFLMNVFKNTIIFLIIKDQISKDELFNELFLISHEELLKKFKKKFILSNKIINFYDKFFKYKKYFENKEYCFNFFEVFNDKNVINIISSIDLITDHLYKLFDGNFRKLILEKGFKELIPYKSIDTIFDCNQYDIEYIVKDRRFKEWFKKE